MPIAFVAERVSVVGLSNKLALTKPTWTTVVTIRGESFRFVFQWNGFFRYYSIDIFRSTGKRLTRIYPHEDEFHLIRNFLLRQPDSPDALIAIGDTTAQAKPYYPSTLGKDHQLYIATGMVKTL